MAQQESDPDSILHFYRKAIHLRKELPVVRHGQYREHFFLNGKVYCYSRKMLGKKLLVICSFTEKAAKAKFPAGFEAATAQCILHNYPDTDNATLRPYECRVYLWEA